ncbi:hypothetical protein STEG23_014321 [Scotinomys teguina]
MCIGAVTYHNLENVTKKKHRKDATNVSDEGGFASSILENTEALELLKAAIVKADYTDQGVISMDMDASESDKYGLDFKSPMTPTGISCPSYRSPSSRREDESVLNGWQLRDAIPLGRKVGKVSQSPVISGPLQTPGLRSLIDCDWPETGNNLECLLTDEQTVKMWYIYKSKPKPNQTKPNQNNNNKTTLKSSGLALSSSYSQTNLGK